MRKLGFLLGLFLLAGTLHAQKEITLEDIWSNGTFRTTGVPGFNFMNDGRHYTDLVDNRIEKYDLTSGEKVDMILDGAAIAEDYNIQNYTFANAEKYIVLRSKTQRIYRRSYTAEYIIYNRETQQSFPVAGLEQVSYATLNASGDKVAYVKDNNLYIQDLQTESITPVTTDGVKNKIINGHTDWVYEEEFSFVKAFEWSVDGDHIAYIHFDESEVREFTMTWHRDQAYPVYDTFKYPKVGEKNSDVSVHIFDLTTGATTKADIGTSEDIYIPRIKWSADNEHVCVYKLNRHQNHLQIFRSNVKTGSSSLMLDEKNKYYIDIHDNLTFVDGGKCFLWTSEQDGYNHIYLYNIKGELKQQITKGNWEVTNMYGYDETNDEIYFQSTEPGSTRRSIYAIDKEGKTKRDVASEPGYNSAQFSPTFDFYVLNHSTQNAPPTYNVYNRAGAVVRPLVSNEEAASLLTEYGAVTSELTEIEVGSGIKLNAAIIKPADFDPNKKYPLFMFLYGGPGSQMVVDRWNSTRYFWWFQLLAQKGYMIAVVDNRGTGGKGEEFKKMTYLQLGKYETIDQINAAKYFGSMPYVDESRIGIFGWSYGGFMSSLCLFKGSDVFKAAIAVAPVTNWKWYDTVYTERYMRTDEENEEGYYDNSPVHFADRLKGNYLLVHGMADDNVHFQNTAEMVNALIKHNKQFDTYFYPNRNHGIYGNNARLHLFTKMTNFVLEKL